MKKWKCTVCSYIYSGDEKPERCPACGAGQEMLIEVKDEDTSAKEMKSSEQAPVESPTQASGVQRKWKCTVCNYIHEGEEPPEKCPVCGADRSFFVEVTEGEVQGKSQSEDLKNDVTEELAEEKAHGLLEKLIIGHHLHPISVHTPNGVIPMAVLFLLGGMIFGYGTLETASFLSLIFVLISMPAVIFTGFVAWQGKYRGALTPVFKIKFFCALVVAVLLTLMIGWRLIDNSIALHGSTASWIYFGFGAVTLVAVGIAGHLGGKLVFDK